MPGRVELKIHVIGGLRHVLLRYERPGACRVSPTVYPHAEGNVGCVGEARGVRLSSTWRGVDR